jgi:hypothetical protein
VKRGKADAPHALDLEALAKEVAPRVFALLLERLTAVETPFSTREGHEPPEFVGRHDAWLATARTIPGAIKLGRWWCVPRPAYAGWLASQSTTAPAATAAPPPANDAVEPWTPRAALLSVGIRPTREGSK